jgi:hypothetical protein
MNSAPIIQLLSDSSKEKILDQIKHLEQLSNEDEEKVRFQQMLKGAKTILNIIEDDPIGRKGTDNFLGCLDRGQLEYAISSAERILKAKSSLGYVSLFGVFGGDDGAQWFLKIEDAENCYLEVAKESLKSSRPEISLEKRKVPLEEIRDYLKEADADELIKSRVSTL